jgi:small subunit ribosomal protein S17
MADDPDSITPPEGPEAQIPDAPDAGDSPTDAPQPTEAAADADGEAVAEAASTEAPEAQESPTAAPAAKAPPAASQEPAEPVSSKERRRTQRSKHAGQPRPARSPEERHAERLLERRKKAARRRARRMQERAKAVARRSTPGAATDVAQLAPVHAAVEGTRRVRQGIVVSDKASKTITVRIDVARRHRRYEKIVRSSSTLHAHDENNDAHEGDVVRVIESRPLSRTKRWKLVDVLERAQ